MVQLIQPILSIILCSFLFQANLVYLSINFLALHAYIQYMHTYMHACIHPSMHTYIPPLREKARLQLQFFDCFWPTLVLCFWSSLVLHHGQSSCVNVAAEVSRG